MSTLTPSDLLGRLLSARSTAEVEAIMAGLPIVSFDDYQWVSADDRSSAWKPDIYTGFQSALTAAMAVASSSPANR